MRNTDAASAANVTHGMTDTRAYRIWSAMLARCRTKSSGSFKNYGARGIHVCERWLSFENFVADMGEPKAGQQLDRINNEGHYEPGNCRWVTVMENSRNRRSTRLIEYAGQTKCITDWAADIGISRQALHRRIAVLKWPLEKALNQGKRTA